ncbi:MAG: phage DNA packaging protein J [Bacteroidetes bacterium]|nr:phage DNA packaging protein J [Bacteroidota bacterium]
MNPLPFLLLTTSTIVLCATRFTSGSTPCQPQPLRGWKTNRFTARAIRFT